MAVGTEKKTTSVLVVEDDDIIRDLLASILENLGVRVYTAESCAETRTLLDRDEFAVALIDLGLPDGNGLSLLPELKESLPWLVPIILTGDNRAESIIETMRAGAFDYLTKPVDTTTLKAALARATEHHEALRDRDRLVHLLSEERELLKAKVEEATLDIRLYAARRNSLLRLARMSADAYTDDMLFQGLYAEVRNYMPLACVALCAPAQGEYISALQGEDGRVRVITSEGQLGGSAQGTLRESSVTHEELRNWVHDFTGLDTSGFMTEVFPQTFWGRTVCTVAFFFPRSFKSDEGNREFLGMCSHYAASEWQEARLFLHATQQASMGNIAVEMAKGFIQGLTAIRTATDVVIETPLPPDAIEGLEIVCDNVEQLQRQVQEFNRLCSARRDTVETVQIQQYIEQALDMLTMAIRNRGIVIEKSYETDCACLLLNGTTLARTFMDLLSSAVRTVEAGGTIRLRLAEQEGDLILFEMNYDRMLPNAIDTIHGGGAGASGDSVGSYPRFLLAQRSIRTCGGKLVLGHEREELCSIRVVLPRNAIEYGQTSEPVK